MEGVWCSGGADILKYNFLSLFLLFLLLLYVCAGRVVWRCVEGVCGALVAADILKYRFITLFLLFLLLLYVCTGRVVWRCVEGVCGALVAAEEELNELDRGSGDGDCGSTLKAGCTGTVHIGCIEWCIEMYSIVHIGCIEWCIEMYSVYGAVY